MVKYDQKTLAELKELCRKKKARVTGRKRDLIERLEAYDRNEDFAPAACSTAIWKMDRPNDDEYRDVSQNTKMPCKLTKEQVFEFSCGSDKEQAKQLYENGYLVFLRMKDGTEEIFLRAKCRAQMKKTVAYFVDVKINLVDNLMVLESAQCECAAGMGPEANCKHVGATLLAAFYVSNGKKLILEQSCTAQLQAFHRPARSYQGSPVKCESFPTPRSMSNLVFDPEPPEFKKGQAEYQAMVHNLTVNYCASSKKKIPMAQLIQPANIYASVSDHTYSKMSPEEVILESLCVSKISQEKIKEIEKSTRGQASSKSSLKKWSQERIKRLQSSQFKRIMRRTDRTDPSKLARSLMVMKNIKCASIAHGRKYEPVAIQKFKDVLKCEVVESGIVVSKEKPYIACSPDGVTAKGNLIEVKCPYTARNSKINSVTVSYLKLVNNKLCLDQNHDYYAQIQGQMYCCDKQLCHFLIYTFKDFLRIDIRRDDDYILNVMLPKLDEFYEKYFKVELLNKYLYKDSDKFSWDLPNVY